MIKKSSVEAFLHEKREKARLHRLWSQQAKSRKPSGVQSPYSSSTMNAFRENFPEIGQTKKNRERISVRVPETFSILDEPKEALKAIYSLVQENDKYGNIGSLYFNHAELLTYDLAAEKILDHLADEIRKERRIQKRKLNLQGAFPHNEQASRFIRAIGIIRTLGLEARYLKESERDQLEIFDRVDNRAVREIRRASETTSRDIAVQRFTDHINNCLKRTGYQLTPEGSQDLGVISGEVIDNAVEHSGGDGWVIAGYLDTLNPENVCEIAIFNFGRSMAATLSDLPKDHFTRQLIQPYLDFHMKKGIFEESWTQEDLLTVIALQEKISCKNNSDEDTRGSGTIDLIEFFQKLYEVCGSMCDSKPKMAILSGNTHIIFDGKYFLKPDRRGRGVIAFNNENSLNSKPDRNYVSRLKGLPFPGTAVCIRFPMQEYQIESSS